MAHYNSWTKEDLIERVKQLENELRSSPGNGFPGPAHASSEHGLVDALKSTNLRNGDSEKPVKRLKKPGSMDPSKHATRFIALKLAYIGKKYSGFECHSGGGQSTIEEELWKALVRTCLVFPNPEKPNEIDWTVCDYSKCGRTDRGVSAFGQVVALRVRSNKLARRKPAASGAADGGAEATSAHHAGKHESETVNDEAKETIEEGDDADDTLLPVEQEIQYCRVLNRVLPPDIRVYAWCANPPPDFSARFSCRERQYRYFFTQPAFAPLPNFLENLTSRATTGPSTKPKEGWLDIAAMRKAAKLFEGLHDFRNFCKIDASKQITSFQRRIFESDIVEVDGLDSALPYLSSPQFRDPNHHPPASASTAAAASSPPKVYYFHVRGSAFLWHQIRCMVAVLFLVGQGYETPDIVTQLLDTAQHPRRPNYVLADDAPLVLWECIFGRDNADGAPDELDWLYVGGAGEGPLNLYGNTGLATELWAFWRERKMDEILANRMLDWVGRKTSLENEVPLERLETPGKPKPTISARVYEGGNTAKITGSWVPMMKKSLTPSPEEANDKYAVRKGYKNAEEMRSVGNWRDAIREAKEKGAAMAAAEE